MKYASEPLNACENTFIIGDIHGCLDLLKRLMDKIPWNCQKDRLIFLGDYLDRGDDPKGVIDYLIDISHTSDRVQCIMGNHESVFLDFLNGADMWTFLSNGGGTTLRSYRGLRTGEDAHIIPAEHVTFLRSLKPWIELEDYYVVHAGFQPGVDVRSQSFQDLIWIREPFLFSEYDFGKPVIFGHTPFSEPFIMDNKIGLDTGAVFGNKLTCLELPARRFYSVDA